MERGENGGSEQPSCLDDGQTLASITKMVEKVIEQKLLNILPPLIKPMVTTTVQQEIVPVAEVLIRRVVKEIFQPVEEMLLNGGTRNDLPEERSLQMKFLDEVSDTVQTSKELIGKKGECLEVALVDAAGEVVNSGPESSAKVEIVLLDDNGDDTENHMSHENFERRIIKAGDKEKPHFAKSVYIYLDKGVGSLTGVKLGQDSGWTKDYNCRLGAQIVQIFRGIVVQEAWTAPFKVQDNRKAHSKKHYPPSLSSEVWRLEKISKKGKLFKSLERKNIKTLRDFLFWLNVKPEELKKILLGTPRGDCTWKTAVPHARTCNIDDKKMYSHESSTEPQMRVIYDAVGNLKGVISESHFVPIGKLSADKEDHAHKLLRSAFEQRYKSFFNDETDLLQQFPSISSEIDASLNSPIQHFQNGNDLTLSENINGLSQSIIPSHICNTGPSIRDTDTPTDPDYEKRETPSLSDDVSRLVNICKDGEIHKCLRDNNISTVEDFLIRLLGDHEGLKRIVNLERQKWEATVSNARACPTDSRMYCYTNLEQKMSVVFNVVGDVLGMCFQNHFVPTSSLPEKLLKADAQDLLACAGENWRNVKAVNDMNHLQQHLSQNIAGASEMVGESSSSPSFGETQDIGSSNSATDHMETDDAAWPCSSSEFIGGLDDFTQEFMKQHFPALFAEPQVVSNSWKWEQLLCFIKCWFLIRRVPGVNRKRKR